MLVTTGVGWAKASRTTPGAENAIRAAAHQNAVSLAHRVHRRSLGSMRALDQRDRFLVGRRSAHFFVSPRRITRLGPPYSLC